MSYPKKLLVVPPPDAFSNVRGEPVLAMIPIDEIMRDLMIRLLNRDPNDPRGLYRDLPHDANLLGLLDE